MNLVIDTNIIIAGLVKDSITRKLILSDKLNLFSVNFSKIEIEKYKKEILEKTNFSAEEFNLIMNLLFDKITFLNDLEISAKMREAKEIMDKIDPSDTPFIAASLVRNFSIWSDDNHFEKQNKIRVFKTKEIIKMCFS
ncbi:MAG: PIN domain-containing protein [Nanoarchaeota archaeon]|mgnify:CR=1 FL=1